MRTKALALVGIPTSIAFLVAIVFIVMPASGPSEAEAKNTQIPEMFRPPTTPPDQDFFDAGDPDTADRLAQRMESMLHDFLPANSRGETITKGAIATLGLLASGDTQTYSTYRDAIDCSLGRTAEPLADSKYKAHGIQGITPGDWDMMSPKEKFDAVAASPDRRQARVLQIAPDQATGGLGQRGVIMQGYHVRGLNSAYALPSQGLLHPAAHAEWSWIEIPVKLEVTDEAILRFEFVRDPGVNAWILQRASLLAPKSVKLPSIVF